MHVIKLQTIDSNSFRVLTTHQIQLANLQVTIHNTTDYPLV